MQSHHQTIPSYRELSTPGIPPIDLVTITKLFTAENPGHQVAPVFALTKE